LIFKTSHSEKERAMRHIGFTASINNKDYEVDRTFDGSPAIYRWNPKLLGYEHIDQPGEVMLPLLDSLTGNDEPHVIIIAREVQE
jgi:hypothetical protein